MSTLCRQQMITMKQQSGQTMVLALVFIVVILIGLLVLFNTGQLTRNKMEVQNAADAAAYSAGILYARELNFMAYTNRAMIANQVTLGQFAAFQSWGKKYELGAQGRTTGFAFFYAMNSVPIVGNAVSSALVGMFKPPLVGMNIINQAISKVMMVFGKVANIYIPIMQKIYAFHQKALTLGTLATQMETIPKIIDDNAEDAKISNFGALAALFSGIEQNVLTSSRVPGQRFLKTSDDNDGKHRFAGFVNDSRDQWTRDRERDLVIAFSETIPLVLADVTISMSIGFQNIFGSTELRYLGSSEKYNWSSLDAVAGGFGLRIKIETFLGDIDTGEIGPDFLPFGGASAETVEKGSKSSNKLLRKVPDWREGNYAGMVDNWKMTVPIMEAVTMGYQSPNPVFGGLPDYVDINPDKYDRVTSAPVFLIGVRKNGEKLKTSDELDIATGQFDVPTKLSGGKSSFGDTTEGEPTSMLSRYIRKTVDQFSANIRSRMPSGYDPSGLIADFKRKLLAKSALIEDLLKKVLPNSAEDKGGVFALAAAEVYYQNPDGRVDTKKYKASTFSPYWQVRLKPIDDDIRRWSSISQGYMVAPPPRPNDIDPHLDNLKYMAN